MKKLLLLVGVACLLSAAAEAKVKQYVSAKASYDFDLVKMKVADGNGIARDHRNKNVIGSHFAYGLRAGYVRGELEFNTSHNVKRGGKIAGDYVHLKLRKDSTMANLYLDYRNCSSWTPYIGAGMGMSYVKTDFRDRGVKSAYNLAWQVMTGITYDINSIWALDAGYRFADYGRVRKEIPNGVVKTSVLDHEILFGFRYSF
ncbi:MAG: porin family protein [Alphaproteobacteria bacterium]|nr:porin family protein [Alphaproteobacteria bacterium]